MEKLETELAEVRATIGELEEILGSRERRMAIIADELREVEEAHGDDRRTEITDIGSTSFDMKDLIPDEEMVITVSRSGYVKRLAVDTYRAQRRGGRGLRGMTTKDEDWVEHLFVASAHDTLMIFTRQGQCHWLEVWQIPEGSRQSRGKPIVNLLNIGQDEDIASIVPIREFDDEHYLFFATKLGRVKRTVLSAYGNIRRVGLNAININEGDELIDVRVTDGQGEIVLATRDGKAIRFPEMDAREMGRATAGVGGIRLQKGDEVVGMVPVRMEDGANLLVVTENGIGKRTNFSDYRVQGRYGQGILNIRLTEKSGKVVAIRGVHDDEQLMFITRNGVVNRQRVEEISTLGRVTQGVRLVNLDDKDVIVDLARFVDEDEDEEGLELDENGDPIVVVAAEEVEGDDEHDTSEDEARSEGGEDEGA
jgi:DNA gyrase subunit A